MALLDSCKLYLQFENNLKDSSAKGNDGAPYGAPVVLTYERFIPYVGNHSLKLSGSNIYISSAESPISSLINTTIEVNVNLINIPSSKAYRPMLFSIGKTINGIGIGVDFSTGFGKDQYGADSYGSVAEIYFYDGWRRYHYTGVFLDIMPKWRKIIFRCEPISGTDYVRVTLEVDRKHINWYTYIRDRDLSGGWTVGGFPNIGSSYANIIIDEIKVFDELVSNTEMFPKVPVDMIKKIGSIPRTVDYKAFVINDRDTTAIDQFKISTNYGNSIKLNLILPKYDIQHNFYPVAPEIPFAQVSHFTYRPVEYPGRIFASPFLGKKLSAVHNLNVPSSGKKDVSLVLTDYINFNIKKYEWVILDQPRQFKIVYQIIRDIIKASSWFNVIVKPLNKGLHATGETTVSANSKPINSAAMSYKPSNLRTHFSQQQIVIRQMAILAPEIHFKHDGIEFHHVQMGIKDGIRKMLNPDMTLKILGKHHLAITAESVIATLKAKHIFLKPIKLSGLGAHMCAFMGIVTNGVHNVSAIMHYDLNRDRTFSSSVLINGISELSKSIRTSFVPANINAPVIATEVIDRPSTPLIIRTEFTGDYRKILPVGQDINTSESAAHKIDIAIGQSNTNAMAIGSIFKSSSKDTTKIDIGIGINNIGYALLKPGFRSSRHKFIESIMDILPLTKNGYHIDVAIIENNTSTINVLTSIAAVKRSILSISPKILASINMAQESSLALKYATQKAILTDIDMKVRLKSVKASEANLEIGGRRMLPVSTIVIGAISDSILAKTSVTYADTNTATSNIIANARYSQSRSSYMTLNSTDYKMLLGDIPVYAKTSGVHSAPIVTTSGPLTTLNVHVDCILLDKKYKDITTIIVPASISTSGILLKGITLQNKKYLTRASEFAVRYIQSKFDSMPMFRLGEIASKGIVFLTRTKACNRHVTLYSKISTNNTRSKHVDSDITFSLATPTCNLIANSLISSSASKKTPDIIDILIRPSTAILINEHSFKSLVTKFAGVDFKYAAAIRHGVGSQANMLVFYEMMRETTAAYKSSFRNSWSIDARLHWRQTYTKAIDMPLMLNHNVGLLVKALYLANQDNPKHSKLGYSYFTPSRLPIESRYISASGLFNGVDIRSTVSNSKGLAVTYTVKQPISKAFLLDIKILFPYIGIKSVEMISVLGASNLQNSVIDTVINRKDVVTGTMAIALHSTPIAGLSQTFTISNDNMALPYFTVNKIASNPSYKGVYNLPDILVNPLSIKHSDANYKLRDGKIVTTQTTTANTISTRRSIDSLIDIGYNRAVSFSGTFVRTDYKSLLDTILFTVHTRNVSPHAQIILNTTTSTLKSSGGWGLLDRRYSNVEVVVVPVLASPKQTALYNTVLLDKKYLAWTNEFVVEFVSARVNNGSNMMVDATTAKTVDCFMGIKTCNQQALIYVNTIIDNPRLRLADSKEYMADSMPIKSPVPKDLITSTISSRASDVKSIGIDLSSIMFHKNIFLSKMMTAGMTIDNKVISAMATFASKHFDILIDLRSSNSQISTSLVSKYTKTKAQTIPFLLGDNTFALSKIIYLTGSKNIRTSDISYLVRTTGMAPVSMKHLLRVGTMIGVDTKHLLHNRKIAGLDAAYKLYETKENLMHVGAVLRNMNLETIDMVNIIDTPNLEKSLTNTIIRANNRMEDGDRIASYPRSVLDSSMKDFVIFHYDNVFAERNKVPNFVTTTPMHKDGIFSHIIAQPNKRLMFFGTLINFVNSKQSQKMMFNLHTASLHKFSSFMSILTSTKVQSKEFPLILNRGSILGTEKEDFLLNERGANWCLMTMDPRLVERYIGTQKAYFALWENEGVKESNRKEFKSDRNEKHFFDPLEFRFDTNSMKKWGGLEVESFVGRSAKQMKAYDVKNLIFERCWFTPSVNFYQPLTKTWTKTLTDYTKPEPGYFNLPVVSNADESRATYTRNMGVSLLHKPYYDKELSSPIMAGWQLLKPYDVVNNIDASRSKFTRDGANYVFDNRHEFTKTFVAPMLQVRRIESLPFANYPFDHKYPLDKMPIVSQPPSEWGLAAGPSWKKFKRTRTKLAIKLTPDKAILVNLPPWSYNPNQLLNYFVETSAGDNGTITPKGNVAVKSGDKFMITVIPDSGYKVDYVIIDGVTYPPAPINVYEFESVIDNHKFVAGFSVS